MKKNLIIDVTGNILTVKQLGFPTHVFEIRKKVPAGYHVWNIGRNMPEEYIPYCRSLSEFSIDATTLVAVKR